LGRRKRSFFPFTGAAASLAAFSSYIGHMLAISADRFTAFSADLGHVLAVTADCFTASSANLGHVIPITADRLPAFSPGLPGLIGRKLVGGALLVGSAAALAGDLFLTFRIH